MHKPPSHTTSYLVLPVPRAIWHPAPQGRTQAALDFRITPSQPPLAQARSHLLAVLMMLMFAICGYVTFTLRRAVLTAHCSCVPWAQNLVSLSGPQRRSLAGIYVLCTLPWLHPAERIRPSRIKQRHTVPSHKARSARRFMRSFIPPPGRRTSEVGCPFWLESSEMCIQ